MKKKFLHYTVDKILVLVCVFGIAAALNYSNFAYSKPLVVNNAEKKINEVTDFYTIRASYPVDKLDSKRMMEQFVMVKVNEKREAWKKGGEVESSEVQLAKDFPDRPKMHYEFTVGYQRFESKKHDTVTYVYSLYEYSGGAHGMTNLATFTFNANGPVAIDSILDMNQGKDITLTNEFAKKLIVSLGESSDVKMIRDGLGLSYLKSDGKTFDSAKCQCNGFYYPSNMQNFIVKDEGIMFLMGQYQVAPYAAGMPEVSFTWDELTPFALNNFAALH